ncbi:peptidoglycan/LPS O-acetylase OafA/YrhL [Microbacterium immunditiarum]|uniref:Peptidoglycan/LPS O-acetylase OafA/YrhL n=1 Tax=Microbacterium immunditiarum TaxID=337480 RepID=A0A7Y9GRE2_9MICO|nr:peptidoglycan/LPS O-acetylase OafA/YrhL [Microbacterium immunditiarum]
MRAVAVGLVLAYHLFPGWWLHGGFIGVDVFFVISGFLITSLLLRERASAGRIRLVEFWRRRARRLLPALALVLLVCSSVAWLIGGDVLVRLGAQLVGAATFSYNWISIAGGAGYFSAANPELFRNVWSLAIEEQFYVLWPLVLPLALLIPWAWARAAAAVLLAAASAGWMAVVVATGGDLTRAYFGLDTHAFGILLGIALAFALERLLASPPTWSRRRGWRVTGAAVGIAAVAGLLVVAAVPASDSTSTFPGALAAASVLSAIAITAAVWPGSAFGPRLDTQPLRWLGDRSYGLYLWHWPILVLLLAATSGGATGAGVPFWIGAFALVLTLAAAELSYRWVESPIRRLGFRGSFAALGRHLTASPAARWRAIGSVAAAVIVTFGASAAVAAAPEVSSGQAAVEAGIDALHREKARTPSPAPSSTAIPEAAADDAEPARPQPGTMPSPSPTLVTGAEITAIGDSVMLASAPGLLERFPGIEVDATVSRSMWAAPGIVQQLADAGRLRSYVVVALGTNGPIDASSLEEVARIAGPSRTLVLVNAYAPRDWIPGVNTELAAFVASHPGTVLADWSGAIAPRTDLLAGDHIHPGSAGGRVFADAVAAAVDRAEHLRALKQHEIERRAYLRLHHSAGRVYE